MAHLVELRGSELEGFWYACICGQEGCLYDEEAPAEMEGATHMLTEAEPA